MVGIITQKVKERPKYAHSSQEPKEKKELVHILIRNYLAHNISYKKLYRT
jgi:hypothetical protein